MQNVHHGPPAGGEVLRPGGELHDRLAAAANASGIIAISHHSAAHVYGLTPQRPRLIHVLAVRGGHPCAAADVIVHHTRAFDRASLVRIGEIPVTDLPSTVVMMAAYASPDETRAMVELACRHISLTHLRQVAEARRSRGRAGPGRLLTLLDELTPRRPHRLPPAA